jgi:hypothetical protein
MKRFVALAFLACASFVPASAQEKSTTEAAISSGPVTPCTSMAEMRDSEGKHECEKRDTARLFLVAGKTDAALRLLCATNESRAAFGDDKSGEPVKCLQSVGVRTGAAK